MELQNLSFAVQEKIESMRRRGDVVQFTKPADREEPQPCMHCGCDVFFYKTSKDGQVCVPYCMNCGAYQPNPAKVGRSENYRCRNQTKNWIRDVKERYGNQCALCGSRDDLEVHHIIPYSIDESLRYEVNNGILLCKKHHKMAHGALSVCKGRNHD